MKRALGLFVPLAIIAACRARSIPPVGRPLSPPPLQAEDASLPVDSSAADASETQAAGANDASVIVAYPGRTEGCPDGMLRVEGDYCLVPFQSCLERTVSGDSTHVAERCHRFRDPVTCVTPKKPHMAFCMDRFEYPNKEGELPWVLTSWAHAGELCAAQGRRLCTVEEFNFACEGPAMLPYVYGYVRDPNTCNVDKSYRVPDQTRRLDPYEKCVADASCTAELARLDQRHRIGALRSCVSWAGIYDLNGNVNEWVRRADKSKYPDRSGIKGGWWGPVRGQCRPTVTFHKEDDYGYEVGFRCCKDPNDQRDASTADGASDAAEDASAGVP